MRAVVIRTLVAIALFYSVVYLGTAVFGGRSPELEGLMERNEALVDLGPQLSTINQDTVRSHESNGGTDLGKPTSAKFFHIVTPGNGYSIDDVYEEVLVIVEADGWKGVDDTTCDRCYFRHRDRPYDDLLIVISDVNIEKEERLSIFVEFISPQLQSCCG